MNANLLLESVIRPVLQRMGMGSPAAEKLLLMTACHESMGFKHKEQLGGGPALSYYQIEPATLLDLHRNYLAFRPLYKGLLEHFWPKGAMEQREALLDDRYSTAVARMIYFRVPKKLPDFDDDVGMAAYWKTYYNTHKGAGTQTRFLQDWERYKPDNY